MVPVLIRRELKRIFHLVARRNSGVVRSFDRMQMNLTGRRPYWTKVKLFERKLSQPVLSHLNDEMRPSLETMTRYLGFKKRSSDFIGNLL